MAGRRRARRRRSRYRDAGTELGRNKQRDAAFASIRRLYCEALPLWRTCSRGLCRRHHCCRGDGEACLPRAWRALPEDAQQRAFDLVMRGGPRGLPPATRAECELRTFSPTNFVR